MPTLNADSLKIGYVILVAAHKPAIKEVQYKAGTAGWRRAEALQDCFVVGDDE